MVVLNYERRLQTHLGQFTLSPLVSTSVPMTSNTTYLLTAPQYSSLEHLGLVYPIAAQMSLGVADCVCRGLTNSVPKLAPSQAQQ